MVLRGRSFGLQLNCRELKMNWTLQSAPFFCGSKSGKPKPLNTLEELCEVYKRSGSTSDWNIPDIGGGRAHVSNKTHTI